MEIEGLPRKRQNSGHGEQVMPKMQTLRARDKRTITELLNQNRSSLKQFEDIVTDILSGTESSELIQIK